MVDEFIDQYVTSGLCRCGCLLTLSCRLTASGRAECPLMQALYKQVCGVQAMEARLRFDYLIQALAGAEMRPLRVNHLLSKTLTADEADLLLCVAAAQQQQDARLERQAQALLKKSADAWVNRCIQALAQSLERSHLVLQSERIPALVA